MTGRRKTKEEMARESDSDCRQARLARLPLLSLPIRLSAHTVHFPSLENVSALSIFVKILFCTTEGAQDPCHQPLVWWLGSRIFTTTISPSLSGNPSLLPVIAGQAT